MPAPILRPPTPCLTWLLALGLFVAAGVAEARTVQARIARIATAVATLEDVDVRLAWPAGAASGRLELRAGRVDAVDLGYAFRDLAWTCPLSRDDGGTWHCGGDIRAGDGAPMRLTVDLSGARTGVVLAQGDAALALSRSASTPDDTRIDLTRVPLAWAQALSSIAWAGGRLGAGTLDGRVHVRAPSGPPLRVDADLAVTGAALDTADATIAAEDVGGRVHVGYRGFPQQRLLTVDASLEGGELLFGSAYVSLPATPVQVRIDGVQAGAGGWDLPVVEWHDGDALRAEGSARFDADTALQALHVTLRSEDTRVLPGRYLSGWLGVAGLGDLRMEGALDGRIRLDDYALGAFELRPRGMSIRTDGKRVGFEGLDGDVVFAREGRVDSVVGWRSATLGGIESGPARLPFRSEDGALRLLEDVAIPVLGGQLTVDGLVLRPPSAGAGLRIEGGLAFDGLDLATLASSFDLPAFGGSLSGRIPKARYADERLDFDGGLSIYVFNGTVNVTSLAMERPFGVAPTLSADLGLDNLDLSVITEVFDFGSITGRMDGHVQGLRLVDWSPTTFDAELRTVPNRGSRQRISQRAVQNISSVGDASFVSSLQGQLIGLFDDFGYRSIGIGCRLQDTVCTMRGLGAAGDGFTIVSGGGIPRLDVVGFNQRVDWPTLVERLVAVGSGEVEAVFD